MTSIDAAECRLCLNRMYNMRNIILNPISSDFELSIPESIDVFFNIKIDRNDKYSKLVCANCLSVIQLMHIHRRRFQNSQKYLKTIIKQEDGDPMKNDDDPPVLEPFFESSFQQGGEDQVNNLGRGDLINNTCRCSKTDNNTFEGTESIRIPMKFLEDTKSPRIQIKSRERNLANLALYGDTAESKAGRRCNRMKRKYLRHTYNEGRPGVIRELIQDQVKRSLYISDFDNDNRLKSIYEYDFNLKRNKMNEFDENLWKIGMQLSVFVCTLCNKVFYSKNHLDSHQKIHKKFKDKMDVWKVIF